ncbi:MAG: hypothetical protein RL226_1496 [Bacteroidota bacterium]|jgi:nicotinamide mononucleotide transporter
MAEFTAMLLSVLYTYLYLKGFTPWCYVPAAVGSTIYVFLCYRRRIYAESFLYVFYVISAIAGYFNWIGSPETPAAYGLSHHLALVALGVVLTVLSGLFLSKKTNAALPYLDAFTTVFSLLATWLMIQYVHENWIYWIVIDSLAIALYVIRKMWITALLYGLYLLLALDGYFEGISLF